jgi:hypothetical protein
MSGTSEQSVAWLRDHARTSLVVLPDPSVAHSFDSDLKIIATTVHSMRVQQGIGSLDPTNPTAGS